MDEIKIEKLITGQTIVAFSEYEIYENLEFEKMDRIIKLLKIKKPLNGRSI